MTEDPSVGVNPISSFAPNGFLVIADTVAHVALNEATNPGSGAWNAFQALGGAVVFAAAAGGTGVSGLATRTLSDGAIVYGPFGSVRLTSGVLVAYWK